MLINCHTQYSLKYGILSLEEVFIEIKKGGHDIFAVTDINNTSACMYALKEASNYGLQAAVGVDFRNGIRQQYVCVARSCAGLKEINDHLSFHLINSLPFNSKAPSFENVFVVYPFGSHPPLSELKDYEYIGLKPNQIASLYRSQFHYLEAKLVILQTASFRNKKDHNAHRLLRAVDSNSLLSQHPISQQAMISDRYLSVDEIKKLFEQIPKCIQNTTRLLEKSLFDFNFETNKNKNPYTNSISADLELLKAKSLEGLTYRYGTTKSKKVMQRLHKELSMIEQLEFGSYFLINWDMVRYARQKGFYYVGRGSGANSLVAYLLRITDVDPVELDLYFERFINPYRSSPPDFDIDFSWTDRNEITQYLFSTYGLNKTALVGTYITFKHKSIFRELGKVFGLPSSDIKRFQNDPKAALFDEYGKHIIHYAEYLAGFPSHLSVHASGILISQKSITNYTSTFMPPKGFPTTQFNMHVAEDIGLHKFDVLSQRGLGKIKDSISIIQLNQGKKVNVHNTSLLKKDLKVKELLKSGKTIGCFYIESPAMRMLLTKLQAEDYPRLVAASSIIRPGVSKSGMMQEYILRHQNKKRRVAAKKELPELYKLMEDTYGVMVYQEDVIKVAHYFGGLTLAEADKLRRGMSWSLRKKSDFIMVKDRFFTNCQAKGYTTGVVSKIWAQIESFANYAFAKGHSASYAVESFQALYLKAYFPLEYLVATLNNGGGFYSPELYLHEARMLGGQVEAPCVNLSRKLTTIKNKTIHLGMIYIRGLEKNLMHRIVADRLKNGVYKSLRDFVSRLFLPLDQLILLVRIGAFRFTQKNKKELLWDAHFLQENNKTKCPNATLFNTEIKSFVLPELWHHDLEKPFDEMELIGFSLSNPFLLLKETIPSHLVAANLPNYIGKKIKLVGYLVTRKNTQTSVGDHMGFGVFLDLEGSWIDSVHFPSVLKKYPFRGPGCYLISGVVNEEFGFISIVAEEIKRLENRNLDTPSTKLNIKEN
ncbi:MAG: DNA polymerase III subunit alpha [Flavobacteriales bacterium]|nr:DNA polymerase III subunit alpha [Flavobacteriales bacterium]